MSKYDHDAWVKQNLIDWSSLQKDLFPIAIPTRASWTKLEDICVVLKKIGSYDNGNHTFFPRSGGLDLEANTSIYAEPGFLEVDFGIPHMVKPKRLLFESFPGEDQQWSYFRLETEKAKPTEFSSKNIEEFSDSEQIIETSPGNYRRDNQEEEEGERTIIRFFGESSFVIFAKASYYNNDSSTYDGRHNEMSPDQFRDYIRDQI